MSERTKTSDRPGKRNLPGFCLTEVVVSLLILAIVSSSVLMVINRSVDTASNLSLRAQAFAIVRENMEQLLIATSVEEKTEYGESEAFPGLEWETSVETFSPPLGADTWVRAVCKATYEDALGETQEVELVHWLTALSESQLNALDAQAGGVDGLLETAQEAADYAGVDTDTIDLWLERGLMITPDGQYIKSNLDLFLEAGGQPSPEELALQVTEVPTDFDEDPAKDPAAGEDMGLSPEDLVDVMLDPAAERRR